MLWISSLLAIIDTVRTFRNIIKASLIESEPQLLNLWRARINHYSKVYIFLYLFLFLFLHLHSKNTMHTFPLFFCLLSHYIYRMFMHIFICPLTFAPRLFASASVCHMHISYSTCVIMFTYVHWAYMGSSIIFAVCMVLGYVLSFLFSIVLLLFLFCHLLTRLDC